MGRTGFCSESLVVYQNGLIGTSGNNTANNDDKPIAGVAAAALEVWLEASGITEGPIFRRILKGGRILDEGLDPTAIRKILKSALPAGVGDFSAHSLRSGFVTEAGRRRMDTADAMAMVGHRNYETFMGYYRERIRSTGRPAGCRMTTIRPETLNEA
jgi:integrase